MHQVWQSKDLKKTGTEEEVREYERKQEDPLSGMRFPYYRSGNYIYNASNTMSPAEKEALVAFANIGGKEGKGIVDWWRGEDLSIAARCRAVDAYCLAYDEACEVARKVNG